MSDLAALFAEEPPDGTHLAVWAGGDPTVIWRDDAEAGHWYDEVGKRWFYDRCRSPQAFADILRDATKVCAVVPLAEAGLSLAEASQPEEPHYQLTERGRRWLATCPEEAK